MQLLRDLRHTGIGIVVVAAISSLPWVLADRIKRLFRSPASTPDPSSPGRLPQVAEAPQGGTPCR